MPNPHCLEEEQVFFLDEKKRWRDELGLQGDEGTGNKKLQRRGLREIIGNGDEPGFFRGTGFLMIWTGFFFEFDSLLSLLENRKHCHVSSAY